MKKYLPLVLLFFFGCEDNATKGPISTLTFIATEGIYGDGNGEINVCRGDEIIQKIPNVGDVVQSLLVDKDKLFVIVNNSHLIKRYTISQDGLSLPGIEIMTDNSSPREMVIVNNKLYFTNWNTQDIKVLNLNTYSIESTIPVDGTPEDIISDGSFLWVSLPMLSDFSTNSKVVKIDISTEQIIEDFEVGSGPEQMVLEGENLWISRTFYDSDWSAFYGSSRINTQTGEVNILNYGAGTVCGGDMMLIDDMVYRTSSVGVVGLDWNLNLNQSAKIGSYNSVYSAGAYQNSVFIGISDFIGPDTVQVHNEFGDLLHTYVVGVSPGDFAIWDIR